MRPLLGAAAALAICIGGLTVFMGQYDAPVPAAPRGINTAPVVKPLPPNYWSCHGN